MISLSANLPSYNTNAINFQDAKNYTVKREFFDVPNEQCIIFSKPIDFDYNRPRVVFSFIDMKKEQFDFNKIKNNVSIINLARELFKDTKPMDGEELEALKIALQKNSKKIPSLSGRL